MNHDSSMGSVNYLTLQLHSVLAYSGRDDDAFRAEWAEIQDDRAKEIMRGYRQGQDGFEEMDLAYRMRERSALISAAQRNGIISKQPIPRTKWNPLEAAP